MTTAPADQLAAFLAAIRQHESGGSYSAFNSAGGAAGAYQFIQSTWSHWASAAGYPQYASAPASAAPPTVQDAAAAAMADSYYQSFGGNWTSVAEAWYYPAWAGDPAHQNSVPAPYAGNTLTIGAYGSSVVATMNKLLGQPNATLTSSSGGGGGGLGGLGGALASAGAAGAGVDIPGLSLLGGGGGLSGIVGSAEKGAFGILLTIAFVGAALGLILLGLTRLFPGITRTVTTALPLAAA